MSSVIFFRLNCSNQRLDTYRASQLLGIDRKTLYLKLKKYGINT
jgi:DNA-binding protein Fis